MPTRIPTFALSALATYSAQPAGVLLVGRASNTLPLPCFQPFRSSYYSLSLCLEGRAELQVNLETYHLQPGALLVLPAHCIKQWRYQSTAFASLDVFFTADFVFPALGWQAGQFAYFEDPRPRVLPLPADLFARLQGAFEQLQQSYQERHLYRTELVQTRLQVLLYETAAAYAACPRPLDTGQARAQLLTRQFKHLVQAHCLTERRLAFYASQLCITPKHLTETVRATTGRGAASFIAEAVTLEARLLLQNPALTIAQVADQLSFADQSAFSRYFRHVAGQSPTAYRQQL